MFRPSPSLRDHPRALITALLLALSAALLSLAGTAHALPVDDLYQAQVPADGQDDNSRADALSAALNEVLTKVSGQSGLRDQPSLRDALAHATRYAQTFSFVQQSRGDGLPKLYLDASFYPPSINQLLSDAGLPIWGKERPQTIVWLAIEADGNRYLLPADGGPLADALVSSAHARGLPITLPLLDIDDRQALSYSDVVGGFTDRVLAASRRYGGNSILIGYLHKRGTADWDARWTHLLGGVQRDWLGKGGGLGAALSSGIDGTADALAQRYAVRADTATPVTMSISGVNGIGDYADTMNYLGGLSVVESVQPRVVVPGQMLLTLNVKGGRQALTDVVALGRLLTPDASVADDGSAPLAYLVLH